MFVASGQGFADPMAGAAAAAAREAPLLLVRESSVPDLVAEALAGREAEGGIGTIYLLGGPAVIDASVEAELEQYAPVTRLSGLDRFETASEISAHFHPGGADEAFTGTGRDFADVLAAAQEADEPRADLTDVCVAYDADDLVLRSRVDEPTDPVVDPNWRLVPDQPDAPRTGMEYLLNVSGEAFGDVDYRVEYQGIEFEAQRLIDARVIDTATNTEVCADESTGEYVGGWYETRLDPEACFGGAPPISVSAAMFYRTGTAGGDYVLDRWPGPDGFMGPVSPGD